MTLHLPPPGLAMTSALLISELRAQGLDARQAWVTLAFACIDGKAHCAGGVVRAGMCETDWRRGR